MRPEHPGLTGQLGNHRRRERSPLRELRPAADRGSSLNLLLDVLLESQPGKHGPPRPVRPGKLSDGVDKPVNPGVHHTERVQGNTLPLQVREASLVLRQQLSELLLDDAERGRREPRRCLLRGSLDALGPAGFVTVSVWRSHASPNRPRKRGNPQSPITPG